jgi:hypothetical protein
MNLVQRATDILLKPKETWPQIEAEPATVASIFTSYVVYLAAIPAIAGFLGASIIGYGGFGYAYRVPIVSGLVTLIVGYVLSLAGVYGLAVIIDALAPNFGATRNPINALKVSAYSATASFAAGAFSVLPSLAAIGILGSIYSIYLLYLGLPALMKAPAEKAVAYTAVVMVAAIVLGIVISAVVGVVHHGASSPFAQYSSGITPELVAQISP